MAKQSRLYHFHLSLNIWSHSKRANLNLRSTSCMSAMLVCLQKRSPANSLGTSSASCLQAFTVKMVPVRAFSGCGPRGLMDRPSLKVPVHSCEIWIWVKILEYYVKLWILLCQLLALLVDHHCSLIVLPSVFQGVGFDDPSHLVNRPTR